MEPVTTMIAIGALVNLAGQGIGAYYQSKGAKAQADVAREANAIMNEQWRLNMMEERKERKVAQIRNAATALERAANQNNDFRQKLVKMWGGR